MKKYEIQTPDAGARLDQFLSRREPDLSRARIQKLVRGGHCLLDGEIVVDPDARLEAGSVVSLDSPESSACLAPEDGPIAVVWQNSRLAVCDKPPGLTTHPCPSQRENTLVQRLLRVFPQLARMDGDRPGVAHRLDKDTSGLIIVALDEPARLKLAEEFAARRVRKEYLALVAGDPPGEGECLEPIGRCPTAKIKMAVVPENQGGKPAKTQWRKLWSAPGGAAALLSVRIFTGRSHQIRVHLSHLGYPLLGDRLYAPEKIREMAPRQMLHAHKIAFNNPADGSPLAFVSPPPEDFLDVAANLARSRKRLVITGNPGSGKSTFRKILAGRGVPAASADDVVAGLYARKSPVSDWLAQYGGERCLNRDGSVDKAALFEFLKADPRLKRSYEIFLHNLVADKILAFWNAHEDAPLVAAEIPLYFESPTISRYNPRPLVVGVNCRREKRWARIASNRGWSEDKIREIENWQLPEEEKMAKCDFVVANEGDPDALEKVADDFLKNILDEIDRENRDARDRIAALCGAAASSKTQRPG